jgi:hypothetical protein
MTEEVMNVASISIARKLAYRFSVSPVLLFVVVSLSASIAWAQAVKVIKIAAPGAVNTFPIGVNKSNIVVGDFVNASSATVGFAYLGGTTFKTFSAPKSSNYTRILGINDSNVVVGDFFGTDGFYHGYIIKNDGKKYSQYDIDKGVNNTSIFAINKPGSFAGVSAPPGSPEEAFVNINVKVTMFYGSGTDSTYALGINSSNVVVGQYFDSTGNSHGFSRDASGTITEVAYPGALQTDCTGINDAGEIVGWYENANKEYYGFTDINGTFQTNDFVFSSGVSSTGSYVGYYYAPGTANCDGVTNTTCYGYLATPQSDTLTLVQVENAESTDTFGINDSNLISGFYINSTGTVHGMILSGSTVTNIDDPKAQTGTTFCEGINSAGDTVGQYTNSANAASGFLYSNGIYSDIFYPGGVDTYAYGINDSGTITGIYIDTSNVQHGFVYNGSTYSTPINYPGGTNTFVWGINDSGLMTVDYVDTYGFGEAATHNGSKYTSIDVPGALSSDAHQINKSGNVVFSWSDFYGNYHGALLKDGAYYLLDDYANGTGLRADGINDSNVVVGRVVLNSTNQYSGFQLTIP